MCYAVSFALGLVVLLAVLTVLRCVRGKTPPNAELMITVLSSLDKP